MVMIEAIQQLVEIVTISTVLDLCLLYKGNSRLVNQYRINTSPKVYQFVCSRYATCGI